MPCFQISDIDYEKCVYFIAGSRTKHSDAEFQCEGSIASKCPPLDCKSTLVSIHTDAQNTLIGDYIAGDPNDVDGKARVQNYIPFWSLYTLFLIQLQFLTKISIFCHIFAIFCQNFKKTRLKTVPNPEMPLNVYDFLKNKM